MENMKICQSCAMPLDAPEKFGTQSDGSPCEDYCCYCYENGAFKTEDTMQGMIETCVPMCVESGVYASADEARKSMNAFFPTLKRWKSVRQG